jgi:hypothetical protein
MAIFMWFLLSGVMRKLYRRMVGGVRRKRGGMNYHGVFAVGKM